MLKNKRVLLSNLNIGVVVTNTPFLSACCLLSWFRSIIIDRAPLSAHGTKAHIESAIHDCLSPGMLCATGVLRVVGTHFNQPKTRIQQKHTTRSLFARFFLFFSVLALSRSKKNRSLLKVCCVVEVV